LYRFHCAHRFLRSTTARGRGPSLLRPGLFRTRVKTTVFVSGGRITSALVAGLQLANYRPPIIVHDRHPRKLSELKRHHDVIIELDLQRAVEQAHLLIIAVRPDSVMELLASLDGLIMRSLL
jgi:pyrroline-5-carboxylate reductase